MKETEYYTTEKEKRNRKIAVIVVIIHIIAFTLGAISHSSAQIGCSRQSILCVDSLFTEVSNLPDLIYCQLDSATAVIFNMENDVCTSITVFCNNKDQRYLYIMNLFEDCNTSGYSSSIEYYGVNSMVFKLNKH